MGLDIYFHKVVKVRQSKNEPLESIKHYNDLNNKRARDRFSKYIKRVIKSLENAKSEEEYNAIYDKVFPNGVKKYQPNYTFYYDKLVGKHFPLDVVKETLNDMFRWYGAPYDAYFRKANFVYEFFSPKLVDECCFVTKADLEDLIDKCDKVLASKNEETSAKLLPTRSGFFFGSTDYDDWYYEDVRSCKKQMKKLLSGFNEDTDIIFVYMSW